MKGCAGKEKKSINKDKIEWETSEYCHTSTLYNMRGTKKKY